jgi:hypothetical protein
MTQWPTIHHLVAEGPQLEALRAWTERALRRAGVLQSGAVARLELTTAPSHTSRIYYLRPGYTADAAGNPPPKLFLKVCAGANVSGSFDDSEVRYYTHDYRDTPEAPLPRCYDAGFDRESQGYHLLLEDLSDTHAACFEGAREAVRARADEHHARALARAIATLHAARWGREGLAKVDITFPTHADFARHQAFVERGVERLLTFAGPRLDARWHMRIRHIFGKLAERLTQRAQTSRGMTLIHGDLNPGNILAPRSGDGRVYLIDRQPFEWSLTRWLGALDLVTCVVLPWPVEIRRALEPGVLREYHATLVSRGVVDYSFEQLLEDYRFALIEGLRIPITWCVPEEDTEGMRWLWHTQLQRTVQAYEDLGCDSVWFA